ncbi:hypothetical protein C8J57DRAFT_1471769 [Mycena rebaudengoi]|nr:hypothetical protein C8J57DRAFT_1471769 [Mycena rebaudengoi]
MSSTDIQSQLDSNYYLNAVAFTLLFYDYFLTLEWEVSRYWGSPLTFPTVLFYANRYVTLFGNIPVVIQYFWTTSSTPSKVVVCGHLESFHQYYIIATQIIVGVMLILRTYALYERNKYILVSTILISLGLVGVAMYTVLSGKGGTDDAVGLPLYIGCIYSISRSKSLVLTGAWAGLGVFDSMIFTLTFYRALSQRRANRLQLITVLLRDGSLYFGVMIIANLCNILTFVLGEPYTRGVATTFTNIISAILISRLMLNLRDPTLSTMSHRVSNSHGDSFTVTDSGVGVFSTYLDVSTAGGLRGRERDMVVLDGP